MKNSLVRSLNILIYIIVIVILSGCSSPDSTNHSSAQVFAMDTVMSLDVFGDRSDEALESAIQQLYRIENLLSTTNPESEISVLNSRAGSNQPLFSREIAGLLQYAKSVTTRTKGSFDVTIAPLVDAWGFVDEDFRVPEESEINNLLSKVKTDDIQIENNDVYLLKSGMAVTMGGIGKGYASDQLIKILGDYSIESAILSLGGNVAALGNKTDGSKWRVLIQDPKDASNYVGKVSVSDLSVISSGGYERNFEQNGNIYHHILDPHTGYPANSGLLMSSIICKDGILGDSLSTAVFVLGEKAAIDMWRASSDFEMILVTDDLRVLATEGISESFEFLGVGGGYSYDIINR